MSDAPNDCGLSRKHIMAGIDASLKRLGMDHVDLYQIHRADDETPIEETLEALDDVVRAGKARYVGASTMPAWKMMKMLATAERRGLTRFVSMQNQLNLAFREEEREMMPLCREEGIGLIPYSPLARGLLAGGRRADKADRGDTTRARSDEVAEWFYFTDEDFTIVDRVGEVARERGVKPAQVALAWVLAQEGVAAPIIGATRIEQLDDAIGALDIRLSAEEIERLEAPYRPKPPSR